LIFQEEKKTKAIEKGEKNSHFEKFGTPLWG
jgi:hypothetical protein